MSIWGHIFSAGYDRVMARTERSCLAAHRSALLAQAGGDVLEIGGGTGANLAYYGPGVTSLTITEPESDNIGGGSASITTNYQAGQDFLNWTDNTAGPLQTWIYSHKHQAFTFNTAGVVVQKSDWNAKK